MWNTAIWITLALSLTPLSLKADRKVELLSLLNAELYSDREKATQSLSEWAKKDLKVGVEFLYDSMVNAETPETKARLDALLREHVLLTKFGNGFVGIRMQSATANVAGETLPVVLVTAVEPDSPAHLQGIIVGDRIWGINSEKFDLSDVGGNRRAVSELFSHLIRSKREGQWLTLSLLRKSGKVDLRFTLGAMPDHLVRARKQEDDRLKDAYYKKWLKERLYK